MSRFHRLRWQADMLEASAWLNQVTNIKYYYG